jgi:hypothetical protein
MGERNNSDMVFYVIAGLVAMVLMHLVWRWLRDGYIDAINKATGGLFFN